MGSVGLRRRHVAPLGIPVDHTFQTTWQGPMEDRKDRRSTVERDASDETKPDDDDARRKMQVRHATTDSRVRAERWRGRKREVDVWTVQFAMVRRRSGNPTHETGGWILSRWRKVQGGRFRSNGHVQCKDGHRRPIVPPHPPLDGHLFLQQLVQHEVEEVPPRALHVQPDGVLHVPPFLELVSIRHARYQVLLPTHVDQFATLRVLGKPIHAQVLGRWRDLSHVVQFLGIFPTILFLTLHRPRVGRAHASVSLVRDTKPRFRRFLDAFPFAWFRGSL